MPTVLRVEGFRFFFYSNELNEPAHVHVEQAEFSAKFWLKPVSLASNNGFRASALTSLNALVRANAGFLEDKWNEYFARR